jgi:hypothetical protein
VKLFLERHYQLNVDAHIYFILVSNKCRMLLHYVLRIYAFVTVGRQCSNCLYSSAGDVPLLAELTLIG